MPKSLIGTFTYNSFSVLLFLVFLISAVGSVLCYVHEWSGWLIVGIFLSTISLCSFVLLTLAIYSLEGTTQSTSGFNLHKIFGKKVVATLLGFFKNTPFRFLFQMVIARGNSMLTLNNDVFMKRIRQLLYNSFYDSPQWQNRGKGNHIYDLSFSNDIYRKKDDDLYPDLKPTRNLQIIAEVAFEIGMTLWFDEKDDEHLHKEACLISCGQFTTCYNLLLYILRLQKNEAIIKSLNPKYIQKLEEVKIKMFEDYNKFKAEPFFLYNHLGVQTNIEDFKALSINKTKFPVNFSGLK